MKIRKIEVRTSQRSVDGSVGSSSVSLEDQMVLPATTASSSGSSSTRSGGRKPSFLSNSHDANNNNNTNASSSNNNMQQAVHSMSMAMKELHTELRDKTAECEALYDTASALSVALQESEQLLTAKQLECERLQLKLQMVTFRDLGDDADADADADPALTLSSDGDVRSRRAAATRDIVEEAEEMLARSSQQQQQPQQPNSPKTDVPPAATSKVEKATVLGSKTAAATTGKKKKTSSDGSRAVMDEDVMPTIGETQPHDVNDKPHHPGPVSVDEVYEDERPAAESGPRQAHFYQVIQERDRALQTVKKLSREVKYARKKNHELKSKLQRSTVLNELAYFKDKQQDSSTDKPPKKKTSFKQVSPLLKAKTIIDTTSATTTQPEFDLNFSEQAPPPQRKPSLKRPHVARQLSWLRRGQPSQQQQQQQQQQQEEEVLVFTPTAAETGDDAVDFGKIAASEYEYLKAIASNDADRAAGCEPVRAVL